MAVVSYWADNYIERKRAAHEILGTIKPGQRVFIGSGCGEPLILTCGTRDLIFKLWLVTQTAQRVIRLD